MAGGSGYILDVTQLASSQASVLLVVVNEKKILNEIIIDKLLREFNIYANPQTTNFIDDNF